MILETIPALILILIAISFVLFSGLTMPSTLLSMLLILLFISFVLYAAYIFKGAPADERETSHALTSGRISYLLGVGILVIGIIVQTLRHNIDIWLVVTLCFMVAARIILLIYLNKKM